MSASPRPGFGRARVFPLPPAAFVWTCLLPGKPPTPLCLCEVTLPWDSGHRVAHLLLELQPGGTKGLALGGGDGSGHHAGDGGGSLGVDRAPLQQHAQMKEANPALLLISSNPRA